MDLTNRGLFLEATKHRRPAESANFTSDALIGLAMKKITKSPLEIKSYGDDAATSNAFLEISDILISRETLLSVGYDSSKADELWARWTHWPARGPQREIDEDDGGLDVTFKDFITLRGGEFPDTDSEDGAEWTASLTTYGLDPEVQARILHPRLCVVRCCSMTMYIIPCFVRYITFNFRKQS